MAQGANASADQAAAERYADAVFDLAKEQNALEAVERDLETLEAAFRVSLDLRRAAASPLVDPEERVRALVAVAESLKLSDLARRFVGVVARNGRAGALPRIAAAYRARLAAHRGEREVEIVAAQPMPADQLERLREELSKALGVKIKANVRIDERLIGGFVARAGSRQFDASLKTKLDGLAVALKP